MDVTVDQAELVRELNLARGAVETATTLPILSHMLLEAEGDRVVITATDLDLAIRCSCGARVRKAGALAVPGERFLDYVKLLRGSDVELRGQENNWIGILCGRSRAWMAAMTRDAWPSLPEMPETDIEIPGEDLARMIAQTEFAITRVESRFALDGAAMLAGTAFGLVATDGHRLALAGSDEKGQRILVPRKAMARLAKLAGGDESVRFAHEGNHLFFAVGSRLLISREMSGQFPDYARVLPKGAPYSVVIEREVLKGAIERVSQFSDEISRGIEVTIGADELKLSSHSEVGKSEESVAVQSTESSELKIVFNAGYLLDFLRVVNSAKITFHFKNGASAGEFRAAGDEAYRYIVMPMRG